MICSIGAVSATDLNDNSTVEVTSSVDDCISVDEASIIDVGQNQEVASTIQVRVEDELKSKSDALFKDLGTDTTTAIRIFLTQAVAANGFPFEIKRQLETNPYAPMTESELLRKLKNSREQGEFKDADLVISDMRSKYGL